jgi:hypothetical protein
MLRDLYRCVLYLHPRGFRKRFAGEMLSIFDQSAGNRAAFRLLADGLLSLARQWALRPEFSHEFSPTQLPAPDGVPSFSTLDPFRPRAGAVIHGLVLSTAVFCITCFAIKYSWIHVLHVRIPEVQFDSPRSMQTNPGSVGKDAVEGASVSLHSEGRAPEIEAALPPATKSSGHAVSALITPQSRALDQVASNQVAQSSATARPQSQASSSAQPAVEIAAQLKLRSDQEPATPGDFQVSPLTLLARSNSTDAQLGTSATNAGPVEHVKLGAADRQRVIDGAIANLTRYYVDPDVARTIADALLAQERSSDDDAVTDGEAFANRLTRQMRDVSHDPYVMMVFSTDTTPQNPPATTPEDVTRYRKEMEENNCTFESVKLLPHNIGYLKFNTFPDATVCGTTVAAAMASLNRADAIIFDLRDNRGGYANMVALIATYLFDHPAHLNDFYNRADNSTEQSWTLPPVSGNRLANKPAFVLTSHTTFSAAEAFSYDLKMLKRATLVGETTSGRGHMGMGHRIDDHFTIRVPGVRVVNPISKTNWEGTGVEPDVKVKAAKALETAAMLAESSLQKK